MDANKTGALIRRLRSERSMTQRELAEALFVSEQAVSKWECAQGCPDVSLLRRQLEAMKPSPCDEAHGIRIAPMEDEMHIAFDHGMSKEHHIRFIAAVGIERVLLVRLYPEQGSELRVPVIPRATYYVGCSRDGLFTVRT